MGEWNMVVEEGRGPEGDPPLPLSVLLLSFVPPPPPLLVLLLLLLSLLVPACRAEHES
jgi:hypothetical protein